MIYLYMICPRWKKFEHPDVAQALNILLVVQQERLEAQKGVAHWWNLMSSSSTAFLLPEDLPEDSNSSLSFRPSFNSGMPDKND